MFTPRDFDYSPYFEIIKYPLFNPDEPLPYYRRLPWTKSGLLHQDEGILTAPKKKMKKRLKIFGRHDEDQDASSKKPSENDQTPPSDDDKNEPQ